MILWRRKFPTVSVRKGFVVTVTRCQGLMGRLNLDLGFLPGDKANAMLAPRAWPKLNRTVRIKGYTRI